MGPCVRRDDDKFYPTPKRKTPERNLHPAPALAIIEKAREIDADEKRSAADKLMGRLAKMKPEPRKQ